MSKGKRFKVLKARKTRVDSVLFQGFITASVVDPFGNTLGIMYNPHYLDILNVATKA